MLLIHTLFSKVVILISHFFPPEQLNRIDEDIKRLLNEKLRILRSMQGTMPTSRGRLETKGEEEGEVIDDPKTYVSVAIEQGWNCYLCVSDGCMCIEHVQRLNDGPSGQSGL